MDHVGTLDVCTIGITIIILNHVNTMVFSSDTVTAPTTILFLVTLYFNVFLLQCNYIWFIVNYL